MLKGYAGKILKVNLSYGKIGLFPRGRYVFSYLKRIKEDLQEM